MTSPISSIDSLRAVSENKQFDTGVLLSAGGLTGAETVAVSRATGSQMQTTIAQLAALTLSSMAPQRQSIPVTSAGQATYTTAGYSVGLINLFVAGIRVSPSKYTATNGTTFTITDAKILARLVTGMSIDVEAAISVAVSGSATVASVQALDPANQPAIGTINGTELFSARQGSSLFAVTFTKLMAWISTTYSQSPALLGVPTAPTPTLGDNSTTIPTTAFVQATVAAALTQASSGVLNLSVAGNANVTLTPAQASNGIFNFTGPLTGNIAVIVPSAAAKWVVHNNTTGNFTLTVKAASSGTAVTQGLSRDLYCDGTVVNPVTNDFPSIALTGVSTAVTPLATDNSQQITNTSWVTSAIASAVSTLTSSIASTYAAIAGSASHVFSVAPATLSAHAVQLAQIQARGLNASSVYTLTVAGVLPLTVAGGYVIANAAVAGSLPLSGGVPLYSTIVIDSFSAGVSILPQAGDTLVIGSGGAVASVAMGLNESLTLINTGSVWYGILGTARDRLFYDARYAALAGLSTQTFSVAKGTAATHAAALSQVQNRSGVVGLIGLNNATTPTTQYNINFSSVTMREPSTGIAYTVLNGALVVNAATAGPAANGRDVAAVFSASQWLRIYAIYNPTTATLASIISAAVPTTGPALPAGYTAWCYLGSIYWGSGSTLAVGNMRGSRFAYAASTPVLTAGTSTTAVAVPIPTIVPPEAGWFELFIPQLGCTAQASGTASYTVYCAITTQSSPILTLGFQGQGGGLSAFTTQAFSPIRISNFGQSFAYALSVAAGATAPTVTITAPAYSMPNGGE